MGWTFFSEDSREDSRSQQEEEKEELVHQMILRIKVAELHFHLFLLLLLLTIERLKREWKIITQQVPKYFFCLFISLRSGSLVSREARLPGLLSTAYSRLLPRRPFFFSAASLLLVTSNNNRRTCASKQGTTLETLLDQYLLFPFSSSGGKYLDIGSQNYEICFVG